MEEKNIVNLQEEKNNLEGMDELKKSFIEHLLRARSHGISIGSKTISLSILSFVSDFRKNNNPGKEDCLDLIDKIQSICEKTTKLELKDFVEQTEIIKEILEAANNNKEKSEEENVPANQ